MLTSSGTDCKLSQKSWKQVIKIIIKMLNVLLAADFIKKKRLLELMREEWLLSAWIHLYNNNQKLPSRCLIFQLFCSKYTDLKLFPCLEPPTVFDGTSELMSFHQQDSANMSFLELKKSSVYYSIWTRVLQIGHCFSQWFPLWTIALTHTATRISD